MVHILAAGQEALSGLFASGAADKFSGTPHARTGPGGAPVLEGCLAVLECRLVERIPAGDHIIMVGEVTAARVRDGAPLLYFQGRYRELAE